MKDHSIDMFAIGAHRGKTYFSAAALYWGLYGLIPHESVLFTLCGYNFLLILVNGHIIRVNSLKGDVRSTLMANEKTVFVD